MQDDVLRFKWHKCKSELNLLWSELSPEDLDQVNGRRDNLVVLLEERYGYARRRAEKEVDLFVSDFEDRLRRAS